MHAFFQATDSFFAHLAAVDFASLGIACGFQALRLTVRTVAWRNIIAAAYPGRRVRWRSVLGAYLGGVGLNALVPARGGDALKLFLVKHRVPGSTYPTLAATLVVETLFDAVVGITLLLWAFHLGLLPSLHSLPQLPNVDWRWTATHPHVLEVALLVLGFALGAAAVWASRSVRTFWRRVGQGFAILRSPPSYTARVASWQALSWVLRLASTYWMLRAFHVPATVHNALLVQIAQSLSTLLPLTPGGAGTQQGLLLYLFRGKVGSTALLSFSVGAHIALVAVNIVLGAIAVALLTRSLRFGRLRAEALRDPEGAEIGDGVAGPPPP